MKKTLIAVATIALTGFAVADCELASAPKASAVYAWKFTGKTTIGTPVAYTTPTVGGTLCSLGDKATVVNCAIRVPGSLNVQGYVYYCDNCCESFGRGTGGATLCQFYMTKPFQAKVKNTADITFNVAHIIGKASTQYEAEGTFSFEVDSAEVSEKWNLTFAGFGSYDKNNAVVKSISGNFAGVLKHPYYIGKGVCADADYWTCGLSLACACDTSADGVAYGTWQARYHAKASSKYRAGYTVALPAWAN